MASSTMPSAEIPPEPFLQRALRFGRALIVGSGATLADFSVFTSCLRSSA